MFRNVMNDLATWYETGADKIAVVRGGKFVGKTWAVADFAMGFFEDHIIIDMDKYPDFAAYAARRGGRRSFMPSLQRRLTSMISRISFLYLTMRRTVWDCSATLLSIADTILTAGSVSLRHPVGQSRERKSARMTYAYMR